eukprot:142020_1
MKGLNTMVTIMFSLMFMTPSVSPTATPVTTATVIETTPLPPVTTTNPTSEPTSPTASPTTSPTTSPTASPTTTTTTESPTIEPTPFPILIETTPAPVTLITTTAALENCEDSGHIKHINWNHLANAKHMDSHHDREIPKHSFNVRFNLHTYELNIDVDLEYLGYATDKYLLKGDYSLGTTYVIGFDSFDSSKNVINEPSTCSNRLEATFDGIPDFESFWTYSEYPYLPDHIGSEDQYLSYPKPSSFWTLSIGDDMCSPLHYEATFSWNELTNCRDPKGHKLITVQDNGTQITLRGTFYVNIVSPFTMTPVDTGFYRVYPLIQQDFSVSITKQINVLSTIGTELFIISILSIFEDAMDGSFKMFIFTQSANYLSLKDAFILNTPFDIATITPITAHKECIASSQYTCGQLFEVCIPPSEFTECPPADFRGSYEFGFNVHCKHAEYQNTCDAFMDENNGSSIALQVESNFVDRTCDPLLYESILSGSSTFYDDAKFTDRHKSDEPYVIGQDTIYVETEIFFPDDGTRQNYEIFSIELVNVFVCTASKGMDLRIRQNSTSSTGGCFSPEIDTDGLFTIIANGVGNREYYGAVHEEQQSHIVRFSFKTFNTPRNRIFLHIQTILELQNGQRMPRRLLLTSNDDEEEDTTNQIRHFVAETSVEDYTPLAIDEESETSSASAYALHYLFLISAVYYIYN